MENQNHKSKKNKKEAASSKHMSIRSILGGDILANDFFKRQTTLLILIMILTILYIDNRYSSQQELIEIDRLKKELRETFNLNKNLAFERFVEGNIYKLLGKDQLAKKPLISIEDVVKKYKPEFVWLVYLGCFNLQKLELASMETDVLKNFDDIKDLAPQDDYKIYKMFKNRPLESILLYTVFINKEIGERYLNILSNIKVLITGEDLIKLGIPQGQVYKRIFEALEKEKVSNPAMGYEDEIAFVKTKYRLFI